MFDNVLLAEVCKLKDATTERGWVGGFGEL